MGGGVLACWWGCCGPFRAGGPIDGSGRGRIGHVGSVLVGVWAAPSVVVLVVVVLVLN
jgi:hypothetical protein